MKGLNEEKGCDIHVVIECLEKLQKWDVYGGIEFGHTPTIDYDKYDEGEWVKVEDIDKLVKELKENVI